jgi:hypothetical protein
MAGHGNGSSVNMQSALPDAQNDPDSRAATTLPLRGGPAATTLPLPDEATLMAAIARLTQALASADDEMIPALVVERAAMREELAERRELGAGVVRLDAGRARRGPPR